MTQIADRLLATVSHLPFACPFIGRVLNTSIKCTDSSAKVHDSSAHESTPLCLCNYTNFWDRRPKAEAVPYNEHCFVCFCHTFRFGRQSAINERIEMKFGMRKLGAICSSGAENRSGSKLRSQLSKLSRVSPCLSIGRKLLDVLMS